MINNLNNSKEKWVTVNKFIEYYDLSRSTAYKLIHEPDFPSRKISPCGYRVDLNKTDEFFKKYER